MDLVNGELLVDPQKMMKDGFKDTGMLIGFCAGRFIEKRFVGFSAAGLNAKGVTVSLVGGGPLMLISTMLNAPLVSVFGSHIGSMLSQMILMIYIIVIWPAVIRLICGKNKEPKSDTAAASADRE